LHRQADDSTGSIKSFEDIKLQQDAGEYSFWPLRAGSSDFQYNFELLKTDHALDVESIINLLDDYKEYSERRHEKKL